MIGLNLEQRILGKNAVKRLGTKAKTPVRHAGRKATAKTRAPSDKDVVLAAAEQLAAAIRRGNKAAADKLLAREFTFIDAAGKLHSRREVLAQMKVAPDGTAARVKVRTYGRVAVVTGASKSAQARRRNDLFAVDIWVQGTDGWKALIHHNNVLALPDATPVHPPAHARPADAKPPECKNPLEFVPYQPRSQAERDIITAFQTLERAVTRNDADEWMKHVADEFVVYRTGQHPTDKALRVDFINRQKTVNGESFVAEVEWMKLWVLGDAAVMRADHVMPGNRRPPYRATRVWVKRDGHWQMALSQQTTIAR
jgi:ketosteroid isomerase-like protein